MQNEKRKLYNKINWKIQKIKVSVTDHIFSLTCVNGAKDMAQK